MFLVQLGGKKKKKKTFDRISWAHRQNMTAGGCDCFEAHQYSFRNISKRATAASYAYVGTKQHSSHCTEPFYQMKNVLTEEYANIVVYQWI